MARKRQRKPASRAGRPAARDLVFQRQFLDDLRFWVGENSHVATRVLDLIDQIARDPFAGIGKPEPLKYELAGAWSRRITQEHRLVYLVRADRIDFLQARYHY